MKNKFLKKHLSILSIILLSFLGIIFLGSFLLMLPISQQNEGLTYINALFLSTSAVCVTGLSPVSDLSNSLTIFGRIILSLLIEIGGLGIVSIVMFIAILFGFKISFSQRNIIKESLNQDKLGGIVLLLKRIVLLALSIQFIGFILNFIDLYFIFKYPFLDALGFSLFHAISSFNNAGFDLFGSSSLIGFSNHYLLLFSTCLMIFLGGLGFIVIFDVIDKKSLKKLTLHSKVIITTTIILLIVSSILYKLFSPNISLTNCIFMAFSTRTAGFAIFNMNELSTASYILTLFLMFIGAGPSSTAGGIKVSTLFALIICFKSFATGKNECIAFKRKISQEQITKAFVLTTFAFTFICILTICISLNESYSFQEILFEVISGFGTVGLSYGITPSLKTISKLILCLAMYVGRLGPITFISLFQKESKILTKDKVGYVEENIIIG